MGIHYSIHKLQEAPTVEAVELVVNVGLLRHVVVLAELEDANSVVGAVEGDVSVSQLLQRVVRRDDEPLGADLHASALRLRHEGVAVSPDLQLLRETAKRLRVRIVEDDDGLADVPVPLLADGFHFYMKPVNKWVTDTREVSCHARLAATRDTENEDEAAVRRTLHWLVAHQQVAELSAARPVLEEEVLRESPLAGLDSIHILLRDDVDDVVGSVEVVDMRTQRLSQVGDDAERDGAETPRHAHRPLRGEVDVCMEAAGRGAALVADHESLPERVLQEIRVENTHHEVFLLSRNGEGMGKVDG